MHNSDACEAPVLLIAFNRPAETLKTLNAIRAARPKSLRLAIDGPRPGRDDDAEATEAVAQLAERVDWPCDVQVIRQPENLGCGPAVSKAITSFFAEVEAGIILEDDCVPHPSFFRFAQELLERYADDERVGTVAGSSGGLKLPSQSSYGFSKYAYIWGWASWRRAWQHFDLNLSDWPEVDREGLIEAILQSPGEVHFWKKRFAGVFEGTGPSNWDYQWMFAHFANRMACVVPTVNLVTNIGSSAEATHMGAFDPYMHIPATEMAFPLVHPRYFVLDAIADREAALTRFSVRPLPVRASRRVWRDIRTAWLRRTTRDRRDNRDS